MKVGVRIGGIRADRMGEWGEMGVEEMIWCGGRHSPAEYKKIDPSRIYYVPLNMKALTNVPLFFAAAASAYR